MKPTCRLARKLVKQTIELRDRALSQGVVARETLSAIWPRKLSVGDFPVRQCVGVNRLLKGALDGSPFGVLDARSKLLDEALDNAPVAVEGTERLAYPKSYATLAITEFVSHKAIRDQTPEAAAKVRQLRAWVALHEGPVHPFNDTGELDVLPEWLEFLPFDAIEVAYQTANAVRCEAITGEQLRLADLSANFYVPNVLKQLADDTEIKGETLRDCFSFAWCLAVSEVARDLKGVRPCP